MTFKPEMTNIPLWNLREEFHHAKELLSSDVFVAALLDHHRPIKTPLFDWHGEVNDLLSLFVQRAIQGVESYTAGAVWLQLSKQGRMSTELDTKIRNPFSIQPHSGTAAAYYHHLPGLLHSDLSIKVVDPEYWEKLKDFYRNVRNPLFHGSHFEKNDATIAFQSFWFIEKLYAWLDQWHPPEWVPGQRLNIVFKARQ